MRNNKKNRRDMRRRKEKQTKKIAHKQVKRETMKKRRLTRYFNVMLTVFIISIHIFLYFLFNFCTNIYRHTPRLTHSQSHFMSSGKDIIQHSLPFFLLLLRQLLLLFLKNKINCQFCILLLTLLFAYGSLCMFINFSSKLCD